MKLRFLLLFSGMTYLVNAQNTITLNADKGKDIINKNIYGHFADISGIAFMVDFMLATAIKLFPIKMAFGWM
jgi:hypothetical protein